MDILVTGASGYVGSTLMPRLAEDGHRLRALARDPRRVAPATAALADVITGDVLSGAGLTRACRGVDVAYYLIHSMERARSGAGASPAPAATSFPELERIGAERFGQAAREAGVRRIVYLGGPQPPAQAGSRHLGSREQVQRTLMNAVPGSVALRASIVIGARSRSFRLMVRLLERMPVLALPAWRRHRTRPIDERDLIELLARTATAPRLDGLALEVAGPETLTYEQMLRQIAETMLIDRPELPLSLSVTPIAARVAAAIAGEDPELVLALMEGLSADLLPVGADAAEMLGVPLHSFSAAVEHALREWERAEPLAAR